MCIRDSVPSVLRSYAGLEHEVTIIGVGERAEIWDRQAWENYNSEMDAGSIAQAMEELGF